MTERDGFITDADGTNAGVSARRVGYAEVVREQKGGARMNALKTMRWVALALGLLVAMAACGPATQEVGTGSESAGLDFTLTSFSPTGSGGTSGTAGAGTTSPQSVLLGQSSAGTAEVSGELMVESIDNNTQETYTWDLLVDESAFTINTAVALKLNGGRYNFYFVLSSGNRSYAGSVTDRQIMGADGQTSTNIIRFTLHPVISNGPIHAEDLRSGKLVRLNITDAAEVAKFLDPAFSIAVNGGQEQIYTINRKTSLPWVYVLLPPATYTFTLKFYDGSVLKLISVVTLEITGQGGTQDVSLEALVTQVSYEYTPGPTPEEDTGNVTFVIPTVIVDQVGGLQNVKATASVVGAFTPLDEELLTLTPVTTDGGSAFAGTVTVPGFTYGPLAWAVQFRDVSQAALSQDSNGVLYAYCAQTVTIPEQPLIGSFFCEPRLVANEVVTSHPVSKLIVNVQDGYGPVGGAVVQTDNDVLGITGGQDLNPSALGLLYSFLPSDNGYTIVAKQDYPDPAGGDAVKTRSASQQVRLSAGADSEITIELPPFEGQPTEEEPQPGDDNPPGPDEDPGTIPGDSIILTASRDNWPVHFYDDSVRISGWAKVLIPTNQQVSVVGDADQYLLILSFGKREVKCWYLGGAYKGVGAGWLDDIVKDTFTSPACTKGHRGGDPLWVRGPIKARVIAASRRIKTTTVTVEIPVLAVQDSAPGHESDPRPSGWHGKAHWNWWGWWKDADFSHDEDHGIGNDDKGNNGNGGDNNKDKDKH
jgi:hypothetical protein